MSPLMLALHTLMLLALGLTLFALGHLLLSVLLRPARLADELFAKDNPAIGAAVAGYDLGLVLSFGSTLMGESQGWVADISTILAYGPAAVVLFFGCGLIARFVLARQLELGRELIHDRNLGLGCVLAGYLIASGLLIHGVFMGQGGGLFVSVVFFAIAQVLLLAVGPVYGRIAGMDLVAHLRGDNVAVGLAYSGCLLGLGAVLGQLLSGDFVDWPSSLGSFAIYGAGGLIALPVVRWLTDLILAPGVKLSHEIAPGGPSSPPPNLAAGMIEGASYLAAGLIVAWSLS